MASCRNTRRVTVEGSKRALFAVTTWPDTENNRSTEALVAGMARYLRANRDKYGKRTVCVFITAGPITKLFAGGGGGEWTTCAMIDDEPKPVWMSPLVTH
jgi:hypothetical protein